MEFASVSWPPMISRRSKQPFSMPSLADRDENSQAVEGKPPVHPRKRCHTQKNAKHLFTPEATEDYGSPKLELKLPKLTDGTNGWRPRSTRASKEEGPALARDAIGRVIYKQPQHPRFYADTLRNHRGSLLLVDKKP